MNPLLRRLGIEFPIVQAPMAPAATLIASTGQRNAALRHAAAMYITAAAVWKLGAETSPRSCPRSTMCTSCARSAGISPGCHNSLSGI